MKVYVLMTSMGPGEEFHVEGLYPSKEQVKKAYTEFKEDLDDEYKDYCLKFIYEYDLDVYELLKTKFSLSDDDYRAMMLNTRLQFDPNDSEDGSISLYNLLKDEN